MNFLFLEFLTPIRIGDDPLVKYVGPQRVSLESLDAVNAVLVADGKRISVPRSNVVVTLASQSPQKKR